VRNMKIIKQYFLLMLNSLTAWVCKCGICAVFIIVR
jgi:hypothetical protein